MLHALAFYLFSAVLVFSAVMVISARNPVHSVLFLILCFFNSAALFILLGAEFLGLILLIVYVGAVAVLFLFVVMMLDISFAALRTRAVHYVSLGVVIGALLLLELFTLYLAWESVAEVTQNLRSPTPDADVLPNTEALGLVLYTDYVVPFQVAGLILLVAMIGAIVLTHRVRGSTRRQNVAEQAARKREDVIEIQKITPNSGA